MGLFKKKADVVDLVELQKRGLIEAAMAVEGRNNLPTNGGVVDLTSGSQSSSGSGFLGFMDSSSGNAPASGIGSGEIANLKVKLEDLEYKVDRLVEKLAKLESGL